MAANAQAEAARSSLLVVDDDVRVRTVVRWQLEAQGHVVLEAGDGNVAWQRINDECLDLVVLDLSLPGMSGLDLLRKLRETGNELPVVVLSGRSGEGERIHGLDLGADDYLVKPFSLGELAARVRSVLRRTGGRASVRPPSARPPSPEPPSPVPAAPESGSPDAAGSGLHIDPRAREVTVHGGRVHLTAREFDLLAFLAAHPRQVFTRAQLLEQVWASSQKWQGEATVTEHVHRLRAKVGAGRVATVRGVGYRLEP